METEPAPRLALSVKATVPALTWSWPVKRLAPESVTRPVVVFTTLAEPARMAETVPARRSNARVEVRAPVEPAIVPDERTT